MRKTVSRRQFLQNGSIAAAGFWIGASNAFGKGKSANEKLNIAVIGTANRAAANISGVKEENIVALCDIDDQFLSAAAAKFPEAKTYNDFRKLLEQKNIDAVVVSTPDHTHAVATAAVLKSGRHVYCEKPLAHSVYEAREIQKLAAKNKKLATQMGTQIHAENNYRRVVELIQSGAIGSVHEVHVWCQKSRTAVTPTDKPPVPPNIHWDLWLGPAPARPYHSAYHPKTWRAWWDFGGGTLGDMACHYMDLPFWALKLRHPLTIEAEGPPVQKDVVPPWIIVHYEFPSADSSQKIKVTWYDGGKKPKLVSEGKAPAWDNGVLFVGERGMLIAEYHRHQLLPETQFKDFKAPEPFIPNSIGHHKEWIQACKTGSATTCNFDYAGTLSEAVLLGNVAYRTGKKLEWDAAALKVKNAVEAEQFLRREYSKGWSL
ncbi:MAG: Gfo/Idh/MocA family oxidoreductase [Verrucomicrobiota bacterium]